MGVIVSKRAGAVLAVAVGLCVAASLPALSQGYERQPPHFGFRYEGDERGNIEGKRASCEVYAKIAQVQADANRKYNCGYEGRRWEHELGATFPLVPACQPRLACHRSAGTRWRSPALLQPPRRLR